MSLFHTIVDPSGIPLDDTIITFNLNSAVLVGDVGKPVALDTTAANTVKVAGDGDVIFGRLEAFEARASGALGAVALQFIQKFPVKSGDSLAVGDTAVGSVVSGEIKKAAANEPARNIVTAVVSGIATVIKL